MMKFLKTLNKNKVFSKSKLILKNTPFSNFSNYVQNYEKQGLFGLDAFHEAKTISDSTKNVLDKCKSVVNSYTKMPTNTKLIETIDLISNECCTLIDGATALYHLHPKEEIKNESFNTIVDIGNFFDELNRNEKFYNKSLELCFSDFMCSWDFMNLGFMAILEKNIEELSFFNKKSKNNRLEENLSEIIENLLNNYQSPADMKYHFEVSDKELNSLNSQILKTILQVYINNSMKDENKIYNPETGVHRFQADYDLLSTVIKKSDNKELSNRAYNTLSKEFGEKNFPRMVEILKYRLKYAQSLGYESFSDYQIHMQTLKINPHKLINILKQMWIDLRPNLIMDIRNLYADEKGELNTEMLKKVDPFLKNIQVDALRSSYLDNYLKTIDEKNITKRYITVGNLIHGLVILTKNLFDYDLTPVMDEDLIKEEIIHESVLLTYLKDGESIKAKIYFDLFNREGKYKDVFSQFTIQGSKTLNMYNFKFKQIPKVILATNFEVTDLDLLNMQISFTDAKNIFHEYGHVLHSVLSKTDFQSLSGNRIPLDFAEIPSHLLEYFLFDYSFCKIWMVDKKSNEVIDKHLHSLSCMQSRLFSNLDLQETLYNAIFDLEIHSFKNGKDINDENILKIHSDLMQNYYISSIFAMTEENFTKFDKILNKYRSKNLINSKYAIDKFYHNIIHDDIEKKSNNTSELSNHDIEFNKEVEQLFQNSKSNQVFSKLKLENESSGNKDYIFTTIPHFKNYPSNYYTYIFGKVFANLIWTDCFSKSQMSLRQVGKLLENKYLSKGYTESPKQLLDNLFLTMNKYNSKVN